MKIGFLLGDRIVLIDYLFSRMLLKKDPHQINRIQLSAIASSLISALPLAETGRIVIIPNPFEWYPPSKRVIEEASEKTNMTVELMSLLNMLSITKELSLHPFTIAESEEVFSEITDKQLDTLDIIGRDAGQYAYTGLLASLLSERLLTKTELQYALQVPLTKYQEIISSQKDFHYQFVSSITKLGLLNANNNIERIRQEILDAISKNNFQSVAPLAKAITVGGSLGSAAIAVLGEVSVISAPLLITGAALSLSAALTGLINSKHNNDDPIISVFKVLNSQ